MLKIGDVVSVAADQGDGGGDGDDKGDESLHPGGDGCPDNAADEDGGEADVFESVHDMIVFSVCV